MTAKSDIIDKLWVLGQGTSEKRLTRVEIKKLVNALFSAIGKEVSSGARVEVRGFGSFSLRKMAAGTIRNVRHGISLSSGERHVMYFKPGIELRNRVNLEKDHIEGK